MAGSHNAQRQAIAAVAGLGLLATLVVAAFPELIVRIMSGTQYLAVAQEAWIFALAGAGLGVDVDVFEADQSEDDARSDGDCAAGGGELLLDDVAVLEVVGDDPPARDPQRRPHLAECALDAGRLAGGGGRDVHQDGVGQLRRGQADAHAVQEHGLAPFARVVLRPCKRRERREHHCDRPG